MLDGVRGREEWGGGGGWGVVAGGALPSVRETQIPPPSHFFLLECEVLEV